MFDISTRNRIAGFMTLAVAACILPANAEDEAHGASGRLPDDYTPIETPDTPDANPKALMAAGNPLGEIVIGSTDAPITVVEYSSLTCNYSADFHTKDLPKIFNNYIKSGKVRWIFREYADDSISRAGFQVALCASRDNPMPYIEGLFRRQIEYLHMPMPGHQLHAMKPRDGLFSIAHGFGMDLARFNACLDDQSLKNGLDAEYSTALREFKVDSTPTFFVNGKVLLGDPGIEEFQEAFKTALINP